MIVGDTLVMLGENKVEHDGNDLGFLIPLTTLYSYTSFLLFLFSQPSSNTEESDTVVFIRPLQKAVVVF